MIPTKSRRGRISPSSLEIGADTMMSHLVDRALALGVLVGLALSTAGCGASSDDGPSVPGRYERLYAAMSITWNDQGNTGYLSLFPNLERDELGLEDALELPGWPGVYASNGKLLISDGESPTMTSYGVDEDGSIKEEAAVGFSHYGAEYAESGFISEDKAYLFSDEGVVWDPAAMAVTRTFELPVIEDREGGQEWKGLSVGRALAARDNRAYVATNWANWGSYEVSEDSLIVVIDTDKDEVIGTISVPCPYVDVATLDDDGYVYFSNWTYSVVQTLAQGKRKACAVRIAPGEDELDASWALTFADVTGGHEGAALRYVGAGKAVFAAYDETRLEKDPADYGEDYAGELADLSNWKLWMIDLQTLEAAPVDGLDWMSGGYYMSRVDEGAFVLAPNDDYTSTSLYHLSPGGTADFRFEVRGWVLGLVQVR